MLPESLLDVGALTMCIATRIDNYQNGAGIGRDWPGLRGIGGEKTNDK